MKNCFKHDLGLLLSPSGADDPRDIWPETGLVVVLGVGMIWE